MFKKYHTIIVIIFLPIMLIADGNNLSGNIYDADTGDPLGSVNLFFEGTDIGTATDDHGNFSLNAVSINSGILNVTMMGYESVTKQIQFPVNGPIKIKLEKTLIEMSSVVITGTRTERYLKDVPVTTQVIKGFKLRESGALDVSHVLGELTGVAIVENQFGTGVELSGFGSDHILVMVDGMEVVGRTNGQLDISQIPTDQIERIEVVKGASSALYGSEAMGGIINIITKKPTDKLGLSINGDAGSYGRFNGNISITGGIGDWRSKFYINSRKYGGNNLNNNSLWENGSKYIRYNTGLRLENPEFLSGILRLDSKLYLENQILNTENIFEDVTDNLRLTNRLEYEGNRENLQYRTGIEYSYYDHLYEQFVLSSGYKKSSDSTIDGLFKTDMTFQFAKRKHMLNGGFGFEKESIKSNRLVENQKSSNLIYGFGQDEWQVTEKSTLLAGLRFDNHSIYGNYISPKLSIMYKPEPISRIRFSYGQGFKAPTFKELFLDFKILQVGYYVLGNPDLDPETSNSFILDMERWHTNKYHGRVNVFYNEINNLIDYVSVGYDNEGLYVWKSENIHKAITKGFDIDLTYFLTRKIEFAIGYSYLDTWDVDNKSPINLKAKHKGTFKIRTNLPWQIKYNLRGQYVGERYYGDEGLAVGETADKWLDKYILLHTNISFPIWGKLEMQAGINNITDVYDAVWGPMPGREWYIGLGFNQNEN